MDRHQRGPALGITLIEVIVAISIVAVAVTSSFLAFASGLRIQEETRVRLLSATLAMKFGDDFANIYNGSNNIATEARSLIENAGTAGREMRAERALSDFNGAASVLPAELARRLDSDNDEIAAHVRNGGPLYFLSNGLGRVTESSSNAGAGFGEIGENRLPKETQRILFAVVGHEQGNALYNHPIQAWPYYQNYPAPPIAQNRDAWLRHSWPGQVEFEDLWNYCTGTWNAAPPFYNLVSEPDLGQLFDKQNRFHSPNLAVSEFGTFADMRMQIEILNDKTQALLAAVLPPTLLEAAPPAMLAQLDADVPTNAPHQRWWPVDLPALPDPSSLGPNGWASLTGDAAVLAHPRPWQVLAISYAAWASLLRTTAHLDGQPEEASPDNELFFIELHRRSLRWACRHAAAQSTDWGMPRPQNRALAWDYPLLEFDSFPLNHRNPTGLATWPSTRNVDLFYGPARAVFPAANPPASGRDSLYFMYGSGNSASDIDRQFKVISPVPAWDLMRNPSQALPTDPSTWTPANLAMSQGIIGAYSPFGYQGFRMQNLPDARRYVLDGDGTGPGTLTDSWGTLTRSTLPAPFAPAERCRELVFWYVDWQSWEDFENVSIDLSDASACNLNSRGYIVSAGGLNLSATHPAYWNPTNPASPGYKGPRDINGNGISGEWGSVPSTVRLRARTLARFPIYDPRLHMSLRH